jgi:8-oxo-dGTP diphosphatase
VSWPALHEAATEVVRGPWRPQAVRTRWAEEPYELGPSDRAAADAALAELGRRGSPAHEGVGGRLTTWRADGERLTLDLQPVPWSARLLADKHSTVAMLTVARRRDDGAWLAGRRAAWVGVLPGEWLLGAGGGIEPPEDAVGTLARELEEEWGLAGEPLTVEALARTPDGMTWLIGLAWVPGDGRLVMNDEHDACAWWPADPADWPAGVHPSMVAVARLCAGA